MIADDFKAIREGMKEKGLLPDDKGFSTQEEESGENVENAEDSIPCVSDSQPDWCDFYNPEFFKASETKKPTSYQLISFNIEVGGQERVFGYANSAMVILESSINLTPKDHLIRMASIIATRLDALNSSTGSDSD